MSSTKYIRPMGFREILGAMFRVYWKIFIPIIILNIIVNYFTLAIGLVAGLFVGPVLMMASNAILGQRVKAWQSIRKGISPGLIFKIAVLSFGFILFIAILAILLLFLIMGAAPDSEIAPYVWMGSAIYAYLLLSPIWIFVPMIMLIEQKGLRASIKRSFQILRKNFRRILLMDLFINLVLTVIAIVWFLLFYDPQFEPFVNFLTGVIVAFVLVSVTGLNVFPFVFVYYEYRARHENYNEELLTQEMGYQPIEEMMMV